MSTLNKPTSRPLGCAMLVAAASARPPWVAVLQGAGYACQEVDDPYAAILELCRRPAAYQAVVLGLGSLFREELAIVTTVKQRFPRVEVWLTQTDGRPAAMAEAMRLGIDALLGEDGLHRLTAPPPATESAPPPQVVPAAGPDENADLLRASEPILTADELRALLEETPSTPIA